MRPLAKTAFLALAVSPAAAWSHISEAGFRQALKDNDRTLVAFVEPSLESCKQLDIEWASITSKDAAVVSIDCTHDNKLCDELDIASYPAIRLFHKDGRIQRYRDVREAPEITSFLRRAAHPSISSVDDKSLLTLLDADTNEITFVAQYGADDVTLAGRFVELAKGHADRHTFAVFKSPAKKTASSVTCYRGSTQLAVRSGPKLATTTALDTFLELCTAPLVVDLNRRNELRYMGLGKSLVHYMYRTASERRAYVKAVQPLAQKYGEYLAFTTIDVREYGNAMVSSLGLEEAFKDEGKPLLAVQNPSNGDVFPFRGSIGSKGPPAAAVVEQFLMDIIQGVVKPWRPDAEGGASHDEL
ncbi:tRNA (adenine(58)-N(1))-methyltransferase non-catalytic subunit trm6 [Sporothrix eucalyptigena]|uniref:Protein disulfide-isomerase n=1 Tax=Sporothrix eucalyptigena TaxID=1812306 RepID=A0ABP0BKF2_9PEZI